MTMIEKLMEMKKRMEEVKVRLDSITVKGDSGQGNVQVHMNGNRKVTGVSIAPELVQSADTEQLEELLQVAINRALEQAERVNESEMRSVAGGILPGMPGLF
jgi:DNA-binding YbaB/EbfC family protein